MMWQSRLSKRLQHRECLSKKSSCYVQNSTVICVVTGEQNRMLPVGEDGSIIKELVQKLERYLKNTPPHYYSPVENLLDLVYEHYTENNSIAPESTAAGQAAKKSEKELVTTLVPGSAFS